MYYTSVSLITGPAVPTPNPDDQDVIDITDPVRDIAKKALADLCKTNQNKDGVVPDRHKIIDAAVDVLRNLPKDQMPLTRSKLNKTVTKSGNM